MMISYLNQQYLTNLSLAPSLLCNMILLFFRASKNSIISHHNAGKNLGTSANKSINLSILVAMRTKFSKAAEKNR